MNDLTAEQKTPEQEAIALREKNAKLQAEGDMQAVMSTPAGRRFVARLISTAGIRKASFTADPSGRTDAFNEGRRDFGIKLEDTLQATCPKDWDLMMSEHRAAIVREQQTKPTPANAAK